MALRSSIYGILLFVCFASRCLAAPLDEDVLFEDDGDDSEAAKYDPANALRQSARSRGDTELVDASDVQKLSDRANANASHTVSNTSLADLESDTLTQLLQSRYRERKRQERLLVIQTQILQRLRMNRQPNISANVFSEDEQRRIKAIVKHVNQFNNNHITEDISGNSTAEPKTVFDQQFTGDDRAIRFHTTVQKVQSFYPSCSLPNNTEKSMWEVPDAFKVYYELPLSRYSSGPEVVVILAKLRLYKVSPVQAGMSDPDLMYLSRYNQIDTLVHSFTNIINVRIYQYVKPLRSSRKERKRLVDTRPLPVEHEGWVDFNVVTSINFWLRHNNKNFGFDIGVEDAFGNKLNPNLFFRTLNCSCKESIPQDPPLPNIIEINKEIIGENETSLFDNATYPTLDLQTADISTYGSLLAFHQYQQSHFLPNSDSDENGRRNLRKRHLRNHHQHNQREALQESHKSKSSFPLDGPCRKETVKVNVSDLNLENMVIVYPKELDWTFCSGSCLSGTHIPEPSWSSNVSSLSKFGGFLRFILKSVSLSIEPRCIAGSHRSLPVIYSEPGKEDDGELQGAILKDFVPTECHCQS